MNIALVYNSLSEYEKALDYFNKSAQSANGFNNDLFHANLWSNMGSTLTIIWTVLNRPSNIIMQAETCINSSAIQPVMQTISLTLASFISIPINTRRHCRTCKKLQAFYLQNGNKTTIPCCVL